MNKSDYIEELYILAGKLEVQTRWLKRRSKLLLTLLILCIFVIILLDILFFCTESITREAVYYNWFSLIQLIIGVTLGILYIVEFNSFKRKYDDVNELCSLLSDSIDWKILRKRQLYKEPIIELQQPIDNFNHYKQSALCPFNREFSVIKITKFTLVSLLFINMALVIDFLINKHTFFNNNEWTHVMVIIFFIIGSVFAIYSIYMWVKKRKERIYINIINQIDRRYGEMISMSKYIRNPEERFQTIIKLKKARADLALQTKSLPRRKRMKGLYDLLELADESDVKSLEKIIDNHWEDKEIKQMAKEVIKKINRNTNVDVEKKQDINRQELDFFEAENSCDVEDLEKIINDPWENKKTKLMAKEVVERVNRHTCEKNTENSASI